MRSAILQRLRQALSVLLLTILVFGGALLPFVQNVAAIQAPENDDIFDSEGYNGAPEDGLEVLPLDEFYPPLIFEFEFSFDVDGSFFGGTDTDTDTSSTGIVPQFTPEEQFQKKESEKEEPRSNIQVSSLNSEPGSEIVALAQPQNFLTDDQGADLFYAWALDNVSLNGVAAGADPLDLPQASSPRSAHSRGTQTDSDGDGMDDAWEVRYGLNPNNPGDAGSDADGDGYTNDVYANAFGEVLIVEPATSAGEPGGPLTNLKEYIWGTDPTNPDTDGDGFTDGQDIAGLGQTTVRLVVPPDSVQGSGFSLRLTTLGHSIQHSDRDTPLVKLDSTVTQLAANTSEQVSAELTVSNQNPAPGETITLETTLGQTNFHEGTLSYNWFVNNVLQEEASGESAFTFVYTIPQDAVPGEVINFSVQALNFSSAQEASAQLDVRVGETVRLQYDPTEVIQGQSFTIAAQMVSNSNPEDLIYHWSVDGQEIASESGQGKTTLTLDVDEESSSSFDVDLRVTTPSDSKEFGRVTANIDQQKPEVDIVAPTSYPEPGQIVELVAIPKYFKNEKLEFLWTVNGEPQDVPRETTKIDVMGEDINDLITIEVLVRTTGSQQQSARAIEYLTVTAPTPTAATLPQTPQQAARAGLTALASLRQTVQGHPITFGGLGIIAAVLVGSLAIVMVTQRKKNVPS